MMHCANWWLDVTQTRKKWLLCAAAALHLMLDLGIVSSQAEQVTFQFDAQVASVLSSNGGANLPFSVSLGDTLTATLSFDPSTNGPFYPQSGALRFLIKDETVDVPGFQIAVLDEDVPNAAPIPGTIADPSDTPIVDQGPGSSDNIAISCLTAHGLYCGSVAEHSELDVWPAVYFSTDANLLASNELVADLEVWNNFSFREMSLSFINSDTSGQTYIGANIGLVRMVPEPATVLLSILAAALLALMSKLRRQQPFRTYHAKQRGQDSLLCDSFHSFFKAPSA